MNLVLDTGHGVGATMHVVDGTQWRQLCSTGVGVMVRAIVTLGSYLSRGRRVLPPRVWQLLMRLMLWRWHCLRPVARVVDPSRRKIAAHHLILGHQRVTPGLENTDILLLCAMLVYRC